MTKREAALEQVKQMRAAKKTDAEIRTALREAGLSQAQVDDIIAPPPAPPAIPAAPIDKEDRKAIIESAINFLDNVGVRAGRYADRYPELGTIRNECIGVARKLKRLV